MRARKPEQVFDLNATKNFLLRIYVMCTDAEAMRVMDIVRSEFPGVIDGYIGFNPDDFEKKDLNSSGVLQAFVMTDEENQYLPNQVEDLRVALEEFNVQVWVYDLNTSAQFYWGTTTPLPTHYEWEKIS